MSLASFSAEALRSMVEQWAQGVPMSHLRSQVRSLKNIAGLSGVLDHPFTQTLQCEHHAKAPRSVWMKVLTEVLCHADLEAQFMPVSVAREEHR